MAKTPYMQPSSPFKRIPVQSLYDPLQRVSTVAHMSSRRPVPSCISPTQSWHYTAPSKGRMVSISRYMGYLKGYLGGL